MDTLFTILSGIIICFLLIFLTFFVIKDIPYFRVEELFTLLGFTLIVIAFIFFFVILLLIIWKISSYSSEEIKKKIFFLIFSLFIVGIPVFIFRNVIIYCFQLDYNSFWDFTLIFFLASIFRELYLTSISNKGIKKIL